MLWFFINVNRGQCWVEVSALTETQILNVSLDLRVDLRGPVVHKTNILYFLVSRPLYPSVIFTDYYIVL